VIIRFGEFTLDPDCRELRRDGALVAIEPQVFSLLLFLIEKRERVVSKDDLFAHVWSGRIVSDAALNSRINAARRAVGDDGKRQHMIRTYPRRGFRFVAALENEAPGGAATGKDGRSAAAKPSLAVLPFANLSGDPDQDYFAEGISEDITAALSRMRWLFVISRNSSFLYRDRQSAFADIARDLGVRYVLDGSIRKAGRQVRISGQLIDAASHRQIWAERYDGQLDDIFSLQDEITSGISAALNSEITLAEIERVRKVHPSNFDAWDHCLQGAAEMHKLAPEAYERALSEFDKALQIDPEIVPAHVGLAWCHALAALHGWTRSGGKALELSVRHAHQAIGHDAGDPRAHVALALAHFWVGEQDEAVAAALPAIRLDPNMPEAHGVLGNALAVSGKARQADEPLQRALLGSPRDPMRWFWYHGKANAAFALADYTKAQEWARTTTAHRPGWAFGHLIGAASAALSGNPEAAQIELKRLLHLIPHYSLKRLSHHPIWTHQPDIERLIEGLRLAGLEEG